MRFLRVNSLRGYMVEVQHIALNRISHLWWQPFPWRFCCVCSAYFYKGELIMKGFLKSKLVLSLVTLVLLAGAIAIPLSGSITRSHAAPSTPAPPFTQCPAIGADTSCGILIVFNADGTTSILSDPSQGPFDSIEDTLVGVQNNSGVTIPNTTISGTSIFGFDGDGICSGSFSG